MLLLVGLLSQAFGQSPAAGLEGSWNGTLEAGGQKLRIVVTVSKTAAGDYTGKFESLDQGATVPFDTVTLTGDNVRMEVKAATIVYEAVLNKERTELAGTFTQGGQPFPLKLQAGRAGRWAQANPSTDSKTRLLRTRRRTLHR